MMNVKTFSVTLTVHTKQTEPQSIKHNNVSVQSSDDLLVLSTCNLTKSNPKVHSHSPYQVIN